MVVESFQPSTTTLSFVTSSSSSALRTAPSLHMVRRGKGSIGKEIGNNNNNEGGMGMGGDATSASSSNSNNNLNWTPIAVAVAALPTEENKVTLIDTNLITMKNAQTNPTGAVSVLKYQKQTYCFAINCPSCQIPLLKAKCVPIVNPMEGTKSSSLSAPPALQCDLCKATYNLKTGDKITDTTNIGDQPGLLGGIVKSLFSSKASGPLKVYQLAEKNGKLLISGLD